MTVSMRRILCPIDFSAHSRRAADHAAAIARAHDSALTILHVAPLLPPATLTDGARRTLLEDMERFVGSPPPGVRRNVVLVQGAPAAEILAHLEASPPDLLVLGTHGRSGFDRLLLGSTTEKLLRKATCPVLTVPRDEEMPVDEAVSFTRLLCPVDFSDASLNALRYALALVRNTPATVTLLYVVEGGADRFPERFETAAAEIDTSADASAGDRAGHARLEALVPASGRTAVAIETLVGHGKPWQAILRVAADRRSQVIAMGVHGRGAVDRMFFGSTTQHVVRSAGCPVLTLRRE